MLCCLASQFPDTLLLLFAAMSHFAWHGDEKRAKECERSLKSIISGQPGAHSMTRSSGFARCPLFAVPPAVDAVASCVIRLFLFRAEDHQSRATWWRKLIDSTLANARGPRLQWGDNDISIQRMTSMRPRSEMPFRRCAKCGEAEPEPKRFKACGRCKLVHYCGVGAFPFLS